jgi:hypothetical protein
MDVFLPAHKTFLSILNKHNVEFMLIGGYAVIVYGYERGTADMDIWLNPTNSNKFQFIKALREFGISENSLTFLANIDFEADPRVMNIGEKPNKIDFLTKVQGVKFNEAYPKRKLLPLNNFEVPVISYHDLVVVKMIAGRPQDVADVDVLQKINKDKLKD